MGALNKKFKSIVTFLFVVLLSYVIFAGFSTGTVTFVTPTEIQNVSGTLVLNVTISGVQSGTNVSNVTFFYDNGSGTFVEIGVNNTVNLTQYTFEWDTTTTNGDSSNFSVNATVAFVNESETEPVNFTSIVLGNFTVDNTAPTITVNTPENGKAISTANVTFNLTIIDNVFNTIANCNLTLDPTNSSGGANINDTTFIPNGTTIAFINAKIPSGAHTWNVTCIDNLDTNNVGTTAEQSFDFGITVPQVTIDLLDKFRVSKTTFAATDVVTIACTRSDDDGFNITEVFVKFPQDNNFSSIRKVVEATAINASRTLETDFSGTKDLGEYIAKCEVIDVLGNINSTTNKTFTIQRKLSKSSSAFSNKNFKPSVAKVKINKKSISVLGKLTTAGVSRLMEKGSTAKFSIGGVEHSVVVKELTKDSITLTISSEPFDVSLKEGKNKNVDVNKDGKNDINIMFHQMFGRHGDVTIALLSETERQQEEEQKEAERIAEEEKAVKASSAGSLIVTIVVIVVIIFIGYALIKGKKR